MADPRMPQDWDDHEGWDRYYQDELGTSDPSGRTHEAAVRFASEIKSEGWLRVWFPGCGVSIAPLVYASTGFDVLATDISPTAIRWQQENAARQLSETQLREFAEELRLSPDGSLASSLHDFREDLDAKSFDCILSIRAFQGLPPASMAKAARVLNSALKPGHQAFFDTQNVQGERRDEIEDALMGAGFWIPLRETETWLRTALRETGIHHVFILGRPVAPRTGEYENDKDRWETDMQTLRSYHEEYVERRTAEWESTKHRASDGATKIANVIYNTG